MSGGIPASNGIRTKLGNLWHKPTVIGYYGDEQLSPERGIHGIFITDVLRCTRRENSTGSLSQRMPMCSGSGHWRWSSYKLKGEHLRLYGDRRPRDLSTNLKCHENMKDIWCCCSSDTAWQGCFLEDSFRRIKKSIHYRFPFRSSECFDGLALKGSFYICWK